MFYSVLKLLHIFGFIAAIGVTLASLVAYIQFWNLYAVDRDKGVAAVRAFQKLQMVGGIGLGVVILSGVGMLAMMDWAFIQVLWFQIKLGLVLLLFVNGFMIGRIPSVKLEKLLREDGQSSNEQSEINFIHARLKTFQIIQLMIFATIIFLTVFRFG